MLWESFYIDDWVSSLDSHEDLETFRDLSTRIIAKVTTNLRKWRSNPLYPSKDLAWKDPHLVSLVTRRVLAWEKRSQRVLAVYVGSF